MPTIEEDAVPDFCTKPVLILGIGNVFFGDDGFGRALVEHLKTHFDVPPGVCILDAGTGVRLPLFTLCLSPVRPRRLLIVDAVDVGREPGEWFELNPADIPVVKLDDFSMHQLPRGSLSRIARTGAARGAGSRPGGRARVFRREPRPSAPTRDRKGAECQNTLVNF